MLASRLEQTAMTACTEDARHLALRPGYTINVRGPLTSEGKQRKIKISPGTRFLVSRSLSHDALEMIEEQCPGL
jgi:hypothetical protein